MRRYKLRHQILVGVAFFGGMYHLTNLIGAGVNILSLLCVVVGTGYVVHSYKEASVPDRIYREQAIKRARGNV